MYLQRLTDVLLLKKSSLALPYRAVGLSAVCDCGINFWSYSITFSSVKNDVLPSNAMTDVVLQ